MNQQGWSPTDIISLSSIIGTTVVAIMSQVYGPFLQKRRERKMNCSNSLHKIFSAMQLYKMHVINTKGRADLPIRSLLKKYENLYAVVIEGIVYIPSRKLVNNIWGVLNECSGIVDAGIELDLEDARCRDLVQEIDNLCAQIDKQFKQLNSIKIEASVSNTSKPSTKEADRGTK